MIGLTRKRNRDLGGASAPVHSDSIAHAIARATRPGASRPPHHVMRVRAAVSGALTRIEITTASLEAIGACLREALEHMPSGMRENGNALNTRIEEIRHRVTAICADADLDGINLITGEGGPLEIPLDGDGRQSHVLLPAHFILPFGTALPDEGPGLDEPDRWFESQIRAGLERIEQAAGVLARDRATLSSCLEILGFPSSGFEDARNRPPEKR